MPINSVPNASNTQLNQTSINQSGGEFQDATVTNDNTATQNIEAPIWAEGKGDILSAPNASNTQANLTGVHQEQPFSPPVLETDKGYKPEHAKLKESDEPYAPKVQSATVSNSNTLDQDIFAPVTKLPKDVPPEA